MLCLPVSSCSLPQTVQRGSPVSAASVSRLLRSQCLSSSNGSPACRVPWGLATPATFPLVTVCPGRGCIWETVGLDKLSKGLCPQTRGIFFCWSPKPGHDPAQPSLPPAERKWPPPAGLGGRGEPRLTPKLEAHLAGVAVWDRPPTLTQRAGNSTAQPGGNVQDWRATCPLCTSPG